MCPFDIALAATLWLDYRHGMLIRPKYHWYALAISTFYFSCALFVMAFKSDQFMVPFDLVIASFFAVLWSSTYTTLSDGVLTRRILFFTRTFSVSEISRIAPHKRNGQRSYGTVVTVFTSDGDKLTLQPNLPGPFLALLRQQAPQAECLI